MSGKLDPQPNGPRRRTIAQRIRTSAATVAATRAPDPAQRCNNDLTRALAVGDGPIAAFGTFTKGLQHDDHGRVDKAAIEKFVAALNQGPSTTESPFPDTYDTGLPATFDADLYRGGFQHADTVSARGWESPISGHTFDLQGADADGIGLPPAPAIGSDELTAEMAEVYVAALLRDKPFEDWEDAGHSAGQLAAHLADLPFFKNPGTPGTGPERRRRARLRTGTIDAASLLRGSTPGAMMGPYISQFMLIGNAERGGAGAGDETLQGIGAQTRAQSFATSRLAGAANGPLTPQDGVILYGVQGIPQDFKGHQAGVDYMTTWTRWRDVQNGGDRRGQDAFEDDARFIHTPRDLATYVHFDALYQAYLNAVLILNGMGAMTDIGLPEGKQVDGGVLKRDAFATFGGPHILSLVTEVATRALKAVRRQKFNIHLRSRPEVLAAAVSLAWKGGAAAAALGPFAQDFDGIKNDLATILGQIATHNQGQNCGAGAAELGPLDADHNGLLPMAFPEGSPMHASYGAGHATVAGACTTVVKAFFEMFRTGKAQRTKVGLFDIIDKEVRDYPGTFPAHLFGEELELTRALTDEQIEAEAQADENKKPEGYRALPTAFTPERTSGRTLERWRGKPLTIQGELDKLAANISIGRNFAGVHYYTDYFESLRMGERIAVSILQEQMLTYREPVTMRFTSFDGDRIMIAGTGGSRGTDDSLVFVWDADGNGGTEADFHEWWNRHR